MARAQGAAQSRRVPFCGAGRGRRGSPRLNWLEKSLVVLEGAPREEEGGDLGRLSPLFPSSSKISPSALSSLSLSFPFALCSPEFPSPPPKCLLGQNGTIVIDDATRSSFFAITFLRYFKFIFYRCQNIKGLHQLHFLIF